jgi:hypothetical protein
MRLRKSDIVYITGVIGGISGFTYSVSEPVLISPEYDLLILFASIILLWTGVGLESIEENFGSVRQWLKAIFNPAEYTNED